MENVIIFGGKGNGTVVLHTIKLINNQELSYNVVGFVNNQYKEVHEIEGVPVLGDFEDLKHFMEKFDAYVINAISSVNTMETVVLLFENNTWIKKRLITIIHPDSIICENVKIGAGTFIAPQTYIGQNVEIGENTFIHGQAYIARDAKLRKFSYLAPKTYVGAEAELGIASYLGIGSLIKERILIGDYAIIGMGSIVLENVPARTKVFGIKATIK
jgi:sugar O-acyltransferase (sialic acid O-acetyltransferase NeuD family)